MAAPLHPGKQSVDLKAPAVHASRIRRDPPPKQALKMSIEERDERNRRHAIIGIAAFTLALMIIIVAVSSAMGWSPSEYTIEFRD